MDKDEKKRFSEFINEIKKHEFLDGATAQVLLNKFTRGLKKKGIRFYNDTARLKYMSYWFGMACKMGILESKGLGFKVNKDGNNKRTN